MATQTSLTPTQELLDVSVTERIQFRQCRRRWYLQTIEMLEPKAPAFALDFGTGMHAALEAYYLNKHGLGSAHTALQAWYTNTDNKLESPTPGLLDEYARLHDLGHVMLDNYKDFDRMSRVDLGDVLAVEGRPVPGAKARLKQLMGTHTTRVRRHDSGRLLCPIVNPESLAPLPGEPMLTARIDLLTERHTPHKGIWIVDHKTLSQQPSDRGLDFDDQVTGYCYIVWRWLGIVPRGVVYNCLIKEEPKAPRILGNGELSTAKDQLTTPDMYREALREHGLMKRGRVKSERHAACLEALLARGWDPFFKRLEPTRNVAELRSFEERLFHEYQDMYAAREVPELRYPNPSTWHCPGCPVNRICHAIEDGSDVEHVIDSQYQIGEDRKA